MYIERTAMNYENEEMEIDLREIFFLLWRKIWILLLAVAAGGIIIGSYSYYFITPTYQSTAKVYIVSGSADSLVSLSDIQIGSSLTKDYLILVKSRPVVEKVIDNLDMDISYRSMAKKIDVSNEDGTRIVNITVTDTNPQVSKKIANETASVVKKQIPEKMQTSEPTIVEKAVKGNRIGPDYAKNTLIGAMLGLLISGALIVLRYLLDDSIHTSEDVERYLQMNTLASIPLEGGTDNMEKRTGKKKRKWFAGGVRSEKKGGRLWHR